MIASMFVVAVTITGMPQGWGEDAKLIAPAPGASEFFGGATALDGGTLVIGAQASFDPISGTTAGAAHVYVRDGVSWTHQAELRSPAPQNGGLFGYEVEIEGDRILVAAPGERPGPGLSAGIHVFERSGTVWVHVQHVTVSGFSNLNLWLFGPMFGSSIALEGDRFAAGAPQETSSTGEFRAGEIRTFVRTAGSWVLEQVIEPSSPQDYGYFGDALALQGDTLVVGAPSTLFQGEGTVHVYAHQSGWAGVATLEANELLDNDRFGWSLSLQGTTLLIGSGLDAVYVHEGSGSSWTRAAVLKPSDPGSNDAFGVALELDGDRAVIGASNHDHGGVSNRGAAYVFERSDGTWSEVVELLASDGAAGDFFGRAVAVEDAVLAVGAPSVDYSGPSSTLVDAGATYSFSLLAGVSYCTAGISSSGCAATLAAVGVPSASSSSGFDLLATTVEGGKDGLFFFGASGRQANPWGNGTSLQCVVPPVARAGLLPGAGTPGTCDGWFVQDLNALWCPGCPKPSKNPGAGAVVQAQLWYRDPQSTSNQTTSLSDASEFTVQP